MAVLQANRARASSCGRVMGVAAVGMLLAIAGCDDLKSRKLVKEGNDQYKKGEFKAAVVKYDEAIALNPGLTKIWINRAYACQSMFVPGVKSPENDKAAGCLIESLDKAVEQDPKRQDLRNLLIQAWLDAGRFDTALAYFQGLIDKDPKNLEAVKTMPVILMKAGKYDEAVKWMQRRIELEPQNPEAHYAVGVMYWERLHDHLEIKGEQRRKMADDALGPLNKALELNSKYVEAMTYTNLVYRERALGWDVNVEEEKKHADEDIKKAKEWEEKALSLLRANALNAPKEKDDSKGKDAKEKKKG